MEGESSFLNLKNPTGPVHLFLATPTLQAYPAPLVAAIAAISEVFAFTFRKLLINIGATLLTAYVIRSSHDSRGADIYSSDNFLVGGTATHPAVAVRSPCWLLDRLQMLVCVRGSSEGESHKRW